MSLLFKKILQKIKTLENNTTKLTNRVVDLENKTVETEWTTCTMNDGFTNGALASSRRFNVQKRWGDGIYQRVL